MTKQSIRVTGIDLAPKNSGVFAATYSKGGGTFQIDDLFYKQLRTEKQDLFSMLRFLEELSNILKFNADGNSIELVVVEAPTQQIFSTVNVDVGYNLGIISYWLYDLQYDFMLVEPSHLYKWVNTHTRDKQRKKKTRAFAEYFFSVNLSENEADAAIHSLIGFTYFDYMCNDPVWRQLDNDHQIYVMSNDKKKGLLDQEKYARFLRWNLHQ